jgi:predicted Ser/Thr protein kinase
MNESEAKKNMETKCPQCGATLPTGALAGLCPACLLRQGATPETAQPDATPFQPPRVEEVAKLFPQLEILAFIGKGGMGAVFKARQPALDRFVALKILPSQAASGPGFAERFNREARALARLNHPNIVAVYEFGQTSGLPFFLMEFVDGLNLRQLERAGKLSSRQALQIVPQICEALQFAHDEGIVHRDIKPENILLDKKGRVKIADFGIAKIMGRAADVTLTETNAAIGTPQYMAPEQVEKPQTVDHRADIFSLGVVFYEMLTGELPLGKFAPPSRKVVVDVRLDDVVLRALEKEPELRYQHASQVKSAVDTIASTAPPPPPPDAEVLDIGSCMRRAWALVQSDFWPIIGVTAFMVLLLQAAWSTAIGFFAGGPLAGGLSLYYLKKIRGERATLETAFSGFSLAFVPLALAGSITVVLTALGFVCLVLPGIYLSVIWWFAATLVIDKRLDFWSAMELSRKVVARHWWKFLGFWLLSILMYGVGLVFCGVGFFLTAPIAMIAAMYAYEDIFGAAGKTANASSAGVGPYGTEVLPGRAGEPPGSGGGAWQPVAVAFTVWILIAGFIAVISFTSARARALRSRAAFQRAVAAERAEIARQAAGAQNLVFGPDIERVINDLDAETNRLLDLDTGSILSEVPPEIGPDADAAAVERWYVKHGVDIRGRTKNDSHLWGVDLILEPVPLDRWEELTQSDLDTFLKRHVDNYAFPGVSLGGTTGTDARQPTYLFKTREGGLGLIQILGYADDPRGVQIRYKLIEEASIAPGADSTKTHRVRQALADRLDAASTVSSTPDKDRALTAVAGDAARAGEAEIAKSAIQRITSNMVRDRTAHESAILLAKRGLRKQALEIAKIITSNVTRDQTLSELAK